MLIEVVQNRPKTEFEIVFFEYGNHTVLPNLELKSSQHLLVKEGDKQTLYCAIEAGLNQTQVVNLVRKLYKTTVNLWSSEVGLTILDLNQYTQSILRGLYLSTYRVGLFKTDQSKSSGITIYLSGDEDTLAIANQAKIEANSQLWAMKLVDTPPNLKGPEDIGKAVKNLGEEAGFSVDIWSAEKIQAEGLNTLWAVGKGSSRPPVFIHCRFEGKPRSNETDLVLLGKGISFDTGGISIKPSTNLHMMKSDMGGAAAVVGALANVAQMALPINMSVIVPSAENNVGDGALLPGDVIYSYSGKTIEVIDTDAEGRLVLADGIAWALKHLEPKVMIDCATLTGSAVRALGNEAAALYSSNDELSAAIYDSGLQVGEKLWPMPIWKDYDHYLFSEVADVANLPAKPIAGSIAAAKFLEFFTEQHQNWAHIDMPGVSYKDNPGAKSRSATGYGVQLLTHFVKTHFS